MLIWEMFGEHKCIVLLRIINIQKREYSTMKQKWDNRERKKKCKNWISWKLSKPNEF